MVDQRAIFAYSKKRNFPFFSDLVKKGKFSCSSSKIPQNCGSKEDNYIQLNFCDFNVLFL